MRSLSRPHPWLVRYAVHNGPIREAFFPTARSAKAFMREAKKIRLHTELYERINVVEHNGAWDYDERLVK